MSTFSTNQVENLIIGNAVASETAIGTFLSGASDQEIQVVAADGASNVASGSDFKVLQKTSASSPLNYEFSDVIEADKVVSVNLGAYQAEAGKSVTVTGFSGTLQANATYEVFVRIMEDGGTLSPENFRFLYGNYVAGSTVPTAAAVTAGIVETLQKSADASNPGEFTISESSGVSVTVAANVLPANPAKSPQRPIYFDVQVAVKSNGYDPNTGIPTTYSILSTTVNNEAFPGVGTSKYVRNLEWFTKGFNNEVYRQTAYPADFNTPYYAETTDGYNMIHIRFKKSRISPTVEEQNAVLSIAVKMTPGTPASNAATNSVLARLRTILGSGNVPADLAVA